VYISEEAMKTAKLFKNGQSQAVRLPKEFRFSGDRVFIKRMGNAVVLLPEKDSWRPLFESLSRFSDDFMESREQPDQQTREGLFE
jgi:antitoxin VapB